MQCIPIKETEEEGVARSAQKSGKYRDQNNGENQSTEQDDIDIRAKSHHDQRIFDQAVAQPHETRREKDVPRLNVSALCFTDDETSTIGQSQHQPDHGQWSGIFRYAEQAQQG